MLLARRIRSFWQIRTHRLNLPIVDGRTGSSAPLPRVPIKP